MPFCRLVVPVKRIFHLVIEYEKAACSLRMFKRLYLRQHRLFTVVRYYASHEVNCGMLTKSKVCRSVFSICAHIVNLWSHIFTGCSQGGKVTFGNMLCTFNIDPLAFRKRRGIGKMSNFDLFLALGWSYNVISQSKCKVQNKQWTICCVWLLEHCWNKMKFTV